MKKKCVKNNSNFVINKLPRYTGNEERYRKSIEAYLNEISKYQPLSPEKEIELAKRNKQDDTQAINELVLANLRFVIQIAKEYQGQGLPLQDLISEGNAGMIEAAKRFDETRGFKFISYAVWWVRQKILQAIAEQSRVVRLPLNKVGAINKVSAAIEKLTKILEREPTTSEIAQYLGVSEYAVVETIRKSWYAASLDKPKNEEDSYSFKSTFTNTSEPPPDAQLMSESLKIEIRKVLSTLKKREAEIIKLYFGLNGDRPLTLEEIGEHFKLTRERVRQIKEKALERLRHRKRLEPLRKYLG